MKNKDAIVFVSALTLNILIYTAGWNFHWPLWIIFPNIFITEIIAIAFYDKGRSEVRSALMSRIAMDALILESNRLTIDNLRKMVDTHKAIEDGILIVPEEK